MSNNDDNNSDKPKASVLLPQSQPIVLSSSSSSQTASNTAATNPNNSLPSRAAALPASTLDISSSQPQPPPIPEGNSTVNISSPKTQKSPSTKANTTITTDTTAAPSSSSSKKLIMEPVVLKDPEISIPSFIWNSIKKSQKDQNNTTKTNSSGSELPISTTLFYNQALGRPITQTKWSTQNILATSWPHMEEGEEEAIADDSHYNSRQRLTQRDINHYEQVLASESTRMLLNKTKKLRAHTAPIHIYRLVSKKHTGTNNNNRKSLITPQLLPLGPLRFQNSFGNVNDLGALNNTTTKTKTTTAAAAAATFNNNSGESSLLGFKHINDDIPRFEWSPDSRFLVASDRLGCLEVFQNNSMAVNGWSLVYSAEFECPIVTIQWLDQSRLYNLVSSSDNNNSSNSVKPTSSTSFASHTVSNTNALTTTTSSPESSEIDPKSWASKLGIKRPSTFKGPRNPYGPHAFLAVSTNGLMVMFYYYNGEWTRFRSTLMWAAPSFAEDSSQELNGNNNNSSSNTNDNSKLATPITHADISFISNDTFVLAVHRAGSRTLVDEEDSNGRKWNSPVVEIYHVQIGFYVQYQSFGYENS